MRKFFKWFTAYNTSARVWRVTYKDGTRTMLLPHSEAKGLRDCFNGKMWIDYDKGYF